MIGCVAAAADLLKAIGEEAPNGIFRSESCFSVSECDGGFVARRHFFDQSMIYLKCTKAFVDFRNNSSHQQLIQQL